MNACYKIQIIAFGVMKTMEKLTSWSQIVAKTKLKMTLPIIRPLPLRTIPILNISLHQQNHP